MSAAIAGATPTASPPDLAETTPALGFSMREARSLLSDEDLRPKAWHYWADFLASRVGFGLALHAVPLAELPWGVRAAAFVASVLLAYRCALFIHELAHLPEREFRAFRFVWNLLCGIPFLIPTFVYHTHLHHHRRRDYGTKQDGEYLPFGNRPVWHLVGYLAQSFVIPILAVVRFGLLTPLTWCGRPIREWVHRHASSMIIDPAYERPLPSARQLRVIRVQEVACLLFLLFVGTLIGMSHFGLGPLSPWFLPQLYATAVSVVMLNAIRTLGAHRYYYDAQANEDRPMTFTEQLLDSVNYPRHPWLTRLWAPVGQQYHALHHLFPSLPYHAFPAVHRKLIDGLPADSPYRQTDSPGLVAALSDLWRRARSSRPSNQPGG